MANRTFGDNIVNEPFEFGVVRRKFLIVSFDENVSDGEMNDVVAKIHPTTDMVAVHTAVGTVSRYDCGSTTITAHVTGCYCDVE
jgi:hypothetical protein